MEKGETKCRLPRQLRPRDFFAFSQVVYLFFSDIILEDKKCGKCNQEHII